jgi:hypothetical protein
LQTPGSPYPASFDESGGLQTPAGGPSAREEAARPFSALGVLSAEAAAEKDSFFKEAASVEISHEETDPQAHSDSAGVDRAGVDRAGQMVELGEVKILVGDAKGDEPSRSRSSSRSVTTVENAQEPSSSRSDRSEKGGLGGQRLRFSDQTPRSDQEQQRPEPLDQAGREEHDVDLDQIDSQLLVAKKLEVIGESDLLKNNRSNNITYQVEMSALPISSITRNGQSPEGSPRSSLKGSPRSVRVPGETPRKFIWRDETPREGMAGPVPSLHDEKKIRIIPIIVDHDAEKGGLGDLEAKNLRPQIIEQTEFGGMNDVDSSHYNLGEFMIIEQTEFGGMNDVDSSHY